MSIDPLTDYFSIITFENQNIFDQIKAKFNESTENKDK